VGAPSARWEEEGKQGVGRQMDLEREVGGVEVGTSTKGNRSKDKEGGIEESRRKKIKKLNRIKIKHKSGQEQETDGRDPCTAADRGILGNRGEGGLTLSRS
jgi:hypothetical protein